MNDKSFYEQKLEITTIIINSSDFLLTAKYLVQNLGLKVKLMTIDYTGIRKLYLHAASDEKVHALNVCLTNDRVAAISYPVLFGVVADNEETFLSSFQRDTGEIKLSQVGQRQEILRWRKSGGYEYYCPEVPLCLLPANEFDPSQFIRSYDEIAVLDWLLIPEKAIYENEFAKGDSWLHWITMECRSIEASIGYYCAFGFHMEDVSTDLDEETLHLVTDTNIGIYLRKSQKSNPNDSNVFFSVNIKYEIEISPSWGNGKYSFARVDKSESENKEDDLILTDVNRCTWKINSSN